MNPDRKFELEAITHFVEGMFKDRPEVEYLVLLKRPKGQGFDIDTVMNLDPQTLPELLVETAARYLAGDGSIELDSTEQ